LLSCMIRPPVEVSRGLTTRGGVDRTQLDGAGSGGARCVGESWIGVGLSGPDGSWKEGGASRGPGQGGRRRSRGRSD
jgi:hypothetical protein